MPRQAALSGASNKDLMFTTNGRTALRASWGALGDEEQESYRLQARLAAMARPASAQEQIPQAPPGLQLGQHRLRACVEPAGPAPFEARVPEEPFRLNFARHCRRCREPNPRRHASHLPPSDGSGAWFMPPGSANQSLHKPSNVFTPLQSSVL